ncbi:alpha/beta-hydrolase [Peniophora sp. CONT]|nr:alpha/beta-hydrolase [Peniophora sp. CONT]
MHPETLTPVATLPDARHLVSADGTAVYAEAIGNPANPHLVFMHGFSLSSVIWDCIFQKTRYAGQFYLIRYDMRGHGRSGKPKTVEGYESVKFAEDFAAVVEAFDLKRPVFIGWSMGGTVVTDIVAHLPPGTLSGAVCMSSLPYLGDALPRVMSEYIGELAAGSLRNDDVELFVGTKITFLDSLFSDPDQVSHELKCLWLGASLAATPTDLGLGFSRTQDPAAILQAARDGTLPLLVLQGSVDKHMMAEPLVAEARLLYKDAEVVVFEGLGHALFYEDVDGVMERIGNFAKRLHP